VDQPNVGMTAPLRHGAFRWLLIGRTVNLLGSAIAPIALAFAVLDLHGSATDLGLVVASRSLMSVLLLLYGGVLADRLPRRILLVGAAGGSAVTQAAVAVLVLTGTAHIWEDVPGLVELEVAVPRSAPALR
jgi:MFS family permease